MEFLDLDWIEIKITRVHFEMLSCFHETQWYGVSRFDMSRQPAAEDVSSGQRVLFRVWLIDNQQSRLPYRSRNLPRLPSVIAALYCGPSPYHRFLYQ